MDKNLEQASLRLLAILSLLPNFLNLGVIIHVWLKWVRSKVPSQYLFCSINLSRKTALENSEISVNYNLR